MSLSSSVIIKPIKVNRAYLKHSIHTKIVQFANQKEKILLSTGGRIVCVKYRAVLV
jgi:hypothetical protein